MKARARESHDLTELDSSRIFEDLRPMTPEDLTSFFSILGFFNIEKLSFGYARRGFKINNAVYGEDISE